MTGATGAWQAKTWMSPNLGNAGESFAMTVSNDAEKAGWSGARFLVLGFVL
jgi:hypothetical protein